jgi:hypothetical protein
VSTIQLNSQKDKVESPHKASILTAINKLKAEGKLLTLHAIAKAAGLTWRQFDDIDGLAFDHGIDLERGKFVERGKGRPAKETERSM